MIPYQAIRPTFSYVQVTVSNEDPALLREVVTQYRPKSALSITGGGEAPLLAILPYVPDVRGVDAALGPLAVTAVKAAMLREFGSGVKSIIAQGEAVYMRIAKERVLDQVAPGLQDCLLGRTKPYADQKHFWMSDYARFAGMWLSTPDELLESARSHLGGLTLEQNLLQDVVDPQEFIYASNAIGYLLTQEMLCLDGLANITRSGGHVVVSDKEWETADLKLVQRLESQEERYCVVFNELYVFEKH